MCSTLSSGEIKSTCPHGSSHKNAPTPWFYYSLISFATWLRWALSELSAATAVLYLLSRKAAAARVCLFCSYDAAWVRVTGGAIWPTRVEIDMGCKYEKRGHRGGYWTQVHRYGAKSIRVGVRRIMGARTRKCVYMTTALKISAENAKCCKELTFQHQPCTRIDGQRSKIICNIRGVVYSKFCQPYKSESEQKISQGMKWRVWLIKVRIFLWSLMHVFVGKVQYNNI